MKLRTIDQREPTTVRVPFEADVYDKLVRYLTYAKETASKARKALSFEPSSFHGDSSNGD